MLYTPDKWQVVKITNQQGEHHYRVFAVWYGGYLGSDSWQMNSGITSVRLVDKHYEFSGASGSVYTCHVDCYGTSGYGQGVLNNLIRNFSKNGSITVLNGDVDFLTLDYN